MQKVFLSLFLGIFALSPLCAQTEKPPEPEKKAAGRVAYFVYTSIPDDVENPVTIMTGTETTQLNLSKRAASEGVKIPADGIIRLVKKMDNPQDPAKPIWKTLAQTTIAENINKALVILLPAPKNTNGIVFQARILDLAGFKGGDYLYLNLTTLNVLVEMGTTKIEIKPGETKIYDCPKLAGPTNVAIRYNFFHPKLQEWQMLSASTVVLRDTRREICIFNWDAQYERMDYLGITFPVTP